MLKDHGRVYVSELAELYGLSEVAIRNTLTELEQAGLLRRVHGGAVSTKRTSYEVSENERMEVNKSKKIAIARACCDLIVDGESLMIDSGSTVRYLATELMQRNNLTIVTNGLLVAQDFIFNHTVNVVLLGGNLDFQYQFTYGNNAVSQLRKYRAGKTIISTDGICAAKGLTTYHHLELDVIRLMIDRSNEVIVLADSSKIGKEGFRHTVDVSCIDILITDKCDENEHELTSFKEKGIKVIEAEVNPAVKLVE